MKQPMNRKQNASSSQRTQIIIVSSLLGVGILALCGLLAYIFRGNLSQLMTPATPTVIIPTMFIPTADCGTPTLVIGSATYQIQNLTSAADGTLTVPADTSGVAYWVNGTNTNYVFMLSPTPDNLSLLSSITAGTMAKATWKDCNSTSYSLGAPEQGSMNVSTLPNQTSQGVTLFIQSDPSGNGLLVNGEIAEEQISTFNTPSASEVQAEISLIETTTSTDGTTIRVGISIQNYGAAGFTLSTTDVTLTAQDDTPLMMVSSEPPLPKEIAPASTETFYFTFPRPPSPTAAFKIFEIEYDIEGY